MQRVKEKPKHRRFCWLLALLLGLIAIRYGLQINIPRVVFLAVIFIACVLGDKNELIAMYMCLIPLHESVDLFVALTICTAIYLLKYHNEIRINASVILVLVMMIWELLHCFMQSFSIVDYLSPLIPLIVLAIIMCSDLSDLNYAFAVRMFAYVTLAVAAIMLLRTLFVSDFNITMTIARLQRLGHETEEIRQGVSVSGGVVHPNSLGIICVLTVTGLMQLWHSGVGKKLDLFVACMVMVFGALTASRTYLVCLVFAGMLLLWAWQGDWRQKAKLFGMIVLLVILALIVLRLIFPDLLEYYISRFFVEDITTGRDSLMMHYHKYIVNNPRVMLFGIGLQDFGNRLVNVYRVSFNSPHNSIQELVLAWGLPGLYLYGDLIYRMYSTSLRFLKKKTLMNWIPLLVILLKGMAGQMLTSSYTMLAFALAYLSLCTNFDKEGLLNET